MCTVDYLSTMIETNRLVLSMMIEQLEKYGQQSAELLKKIDELTEDTETSLDSVEMEFTSKEAEDLKRIFVNILGLLNTKEDSCKEACKQYIKTFKSLLLSYPKYKKLNMSDFVRNEYVDFCNKNEGNDDKNFRLEIDTIKDLLYED